MRWKADSILTEAAGLALSRGVRAPSAVPSEGRSSPTPVEFGTAVSRIAASPQRDPGQGRTHRQSNDEHYDERHHERLSADRHEYGHKQDADREQWQKDKERNRESHASWLSAEESQPAQYNHRCDKSEVQDINRVHRPTGSC